MQFHRSGQRDDRRRRVLTDGRCARTATEPSRQATMRSPTDPETPPRRSENYGDAAFMDRQPRLMDLVPRRLAVFLLVFVAGLAVIAGLEGLYVWMPRLAPMTTDRRVAAFDLDGEGSLAVWFSSTTLALAGLLAILVFSVRRHKIDDYRGHYRIWIWAALCWLLMSIDEASSLHEGFKEMMVALTGDRVFGDGSIWWAAPYFFLLGAVGTRLLVDMRHCRLSSAALVSVAACYALAVAIQLGWILPEYGARAVMVEEGAEMIGNLMLLLAMGLHARYVILDAEGLVAPRKKREKQAFEDETDPPWEQVRRPMAARSVIVHPPHGIAPPSKTPTSAAPPRLAVSMSAQVDAAQPSAAASDSDQADQAGPPVQRKLSKAERKALRKRLVEMKARREKRQRGR